MTKTMVELIDGVADSAKGLWYRAKKLAVDDLKRFRALARETAVLRQQEVQARRQYYEMLGFYRFGDWKKSGIPVEAVTRALDQAKEAVRSAESARVEQQWNFEKEIDYQFDREEYGMDSILIRENLMRDALTELGTSGLDAKEPSPLARLLAGHDRLADRQLTVWIKDLEPEPQA